MLFSRKTHGAVCLCLFSCCLLGQKEVMCKSTVPTDGAAAAEVGSGLSGFIIGLTGQFGLTGLTGECKVPKVSYMNPHEASKQGGKRSTIRTNFKFE